MTPALLLDTSGLLAYHSARESQHDEARALFRGSGGRLTHSYVLAELVALAQARGILRPPVLRFIREMLSHPAVEVVWVSAAQNDAALALLEARPDKRYSLCDAVSFVLMREREVTDALTTDYHFEQEGFHRLLQP